MSIDLSTVYAAHEDTAARATAPYMDALRGSSILAIAQEVRDLRATGREVYNLTIGDFDSKLFPIPQALTEAIKDALDAGQTTYPPAVGLPELRKAIQGLYRRDLGLDFPVDAILAGSGARPPIYAAFAALVADGDHVVYPVPSWNINHYTFLFRGKGVPLVTTPEQGFMPTAAQVAPHIADARLIVINSPSNPAGTVIAEEELAAICDLILAENLKRRERGERPVFLLYDAVYWQLVYGEARHCTPMGLRPDMAAYTVMVDAISKSWAATGLRVGWCTAPPWVRAKMQAIVGHMGAWAGRAEQLATARVLDDPSLTADYMATFHGGLNERLSTLDKGIQALAASGLPVRCLPAQGALYLSVQLDVVGWRTPAGEVLATDEDVRRYALHEAGVAVVPFPAFGYPAGTGWVRMSVGSVSVADCDATVTALGAALRKLSPPA